jgi:hypothetical protein
MRRAFRSGLVLALLLPGALRAQPAGQAVYLELGGSGGLGSINYERVFREGATVAWAWRAGFSGAPIDRNNGTALVFPVMAHALVGRTAHRLDLGLGQGLTVTTRGSAFARATTTIGYRYAPPDGRFFGRLAYTPILSYLVDRQIEHWGGLVIGYRLPTPEP